MVGVLTQTCTNILTITPPKADGVASDHELGCQDIEMSKG